MGRYVAKPKFRVHSMENCSKALKFIESQHIKLVSIGAEDIVDGDIKLILGLVWMLIQARYTLAKEQQHQQRRQVDGALKNDLLKWIRGKVRAYPGVVRPTNFKQSFQDGKVLYALVDSLKELSTKEKNFNFANYRGEKPENEVKDAIQWAENNLNIPAILDPIDMVNFPDELSNIAYLSAFMNFATSEPDPTDPSKCMIEGWKNVVVNTPSMFTILSKTEAGTPQTQGGDLFEVLLSCQLPPMAPPPGTTAAPPGQKTSVARGRGQAATSAAAAVGPTLVDIPNEVVDLNNGLYEIKFIPKNIGKLTGTVRLADTGEDVQGSPLKGFVIPDKEFTLTANGVHLTHAHVNRTLGFNITVVGPDGGNLEVPLDCFEVTFVPLVTSMSVMTVPVVASDTRKGEYEVMYQLANPGTYSVVCGLFGQERARYTLMCQDAVDVQLVNCSMTGPGIAGGELPEENISFTAEFTQIGNKPLNVLKEDINCKIVGPYQTLTPTITMNHPGNFTVTYYPTVMGDYEVAMSVHGSLVGTAKPSFTVGGLKCILSGPGVHGGCIKRPLRFKVGFYDSNGQVAGSAFNTLDKDNSGSLDKEEITSFLETVLPIPKVAEMFDKLLIEANFQGNDKKKKIEALVDVIFQKYDADGSGDIGMDEFKTWSSTVPFIETLFAVREGQLEVKITGPDASLSPLVKAHPDEPGSYDVEYKPALPGKYQIDIFVNHRSVVGSSVAAYCIETDLNTELTGSGLTKYAHVNYPLLNTLSLYDEKKKLFPLPINLLEVTVIAGTTKLDSVVTPKEKGVYDIRYNCDTVGTYELQVYAFGQPLGTPYSIRITERPPTSPEKTTVETVRDFLENQPGSFQIVTRSADGTPQMSGGDTFHVALVGAKNTSFVFRVNDLDTGVYEVEFLPTVFGKMTIDVQLGSNPIKDCPTFSFVLPSISYKINNYGKGLEGGFVGYPQRIFSELIDSSRSPIPIPPDCFDLKITSTSTGKITPTISANPRGTFEITYIPQTTGDYTFLFTYFGKHLPAKITAKVVERPPTDAGQCEVEDMTDFVVNVPGEFHIVAKTRSGNLQTVGGDAFDVLVVGHGGKKFPVTVTDLHNGQYGVEFVPTVVGRMKILVKFHDTFIKGSPFLVYAIPESLGCLDSIDGPSTALTNTPIPFTIRFCADDLLPIPPDCFEIRATTTTGEDLPLSLTIETHTHSPTSFEFLETFQIPSPGDYQLRFSIFGNQLEDRTLVVTEPSSQPTASGTVEVQGILKYAVVYQVMKFQVVVNQSAGIKNPADFSVTAKGPHMEWKVTVTDMGSGIYEVMFKPKGAGITMVSVMVKGTPVPGSPFSILVTGHPFVCVLQGKGSYRGSVNQKLNFDLISSIVEMDTKILVPPDAVLVELEGPEKVIPMVVPSPSGNGNYHVTYSVKTCGRYTIKVTLWDTMVLESFVDINMNAKYN